MIRGGRPLRFLGGVIGGWVGLRVFLLWPQIDSIESLTRALVPVAIAEPGGVTRRPPLQRMPRIAAARPRVAVAPRVIAPRASRAPDPERVALALLGLVRFGAAEPLAEDERIIAGLPRHIAPGGTRSRLSGSAWLVARGGGGLGGSLGGGQLGGSQAGVRLAYALNSGRSLALATRLSSPLGAGSRELALGLEWQPTRLPLRLVTEQRIAIDGGRGGPMIGIVGGAGPVAIGAGFVAEGYGQAGWIARDGGEGFADGAARVARGVATLGVVPVQLGGGIWGAAQKGTARLDLGPSLSAAVPVGSRRVRVSLDWRQRVAGNARPGSGLVLTLGGDF